MCLSHNASDELKGILTQKEREREIEQLVRENSEVVYVGKLQGKCTYTRQWTLLSSQVDLGSV